MSRNTPYLQRRGDTYGFRIAVPFALQKYLRCRELTKSLNTSDKLIASMHALQLASQVKRFFYDINKMSKKTELSDDGIRLDYVLKIDLNSDGSPTSIMIEAEPEETDAANAAVSNVIEKLKVLRAPSPALQVKSNPNVYGITLKHVTDDFISRYPKSQVAMLKKHQACIPALVEVVGNKEISTLKRADLTDFFDIVHRLPPRWADIKRQKGLTVRQIAELSHPILLSEKTFNQTYKASITPFLKWAIENYGDQGFPSIQISTIKFEGERLAGLNKQRAFTLDELKLLFSNEEMIEYAADPLNVHCYWLPLVGLYTGARVNEICQINPQTDICQDSKTGIWYFLITEETEADDDVQKSVKTISSKRTIPIHSRLLNHGFLDYFEAVKAAGHKRLFAAWPPRRGRASGEAEKWFRQLLERLKLRDDTPGRKIVGMHAFRHTLSNAAMNAGVDESSLVGHVGEGTAVGRGYQGELWLENKQALLEKIQFDLKLARPVKPSIRG